MRLFREALLERLVAKHAISEELKAKLLTWRHPGFSTHVGEPIPSNDARVIEDMKSYVVRNPVSLKRLVYIDGQKAVIYRARGARAKEKALLEGAKAEAPRKGRCSPSWARLISKIYHADPLTCRKCGGPLQIVAYINDHFTIKAILDHLGIGPPEIERPPPEIHCAPVDDEGRDLEGVAEGLALP